jgi:hypothetical protein
MTKEFPMTNPEASKHPAANLPFELRHSLVIRISSLDIHLSRSLVNIAEFQITL